MKKKDRLALISVFIFAFLIRLIALNQSLWLDEATTAKVVKTLSFTGIVTQFSPGDFHPPLYYLLMKFWTSIFGYSEIALRFPSVIFTLLTGLVVYRIGTLLKNQLVGWWAAVFFLFNPLIVYYSQEARMYGMVTFILSISLYYLLVITGSDDHLVQDQKLKIKDQKFSAKFKNNVLFGLSCVLALATFYGSIFFIAAAWCYLIYKKQWQAFLFSFFIVFCLFFILSPLLLAQLANSRQSLLLVKNWALVLGRADIKNLLLIPLKFSIGRISFYPKWLYYLVSTIFSGVVFFSALKGGLQSKKLAILFVLPLIFGLAASFFTPLLQYFRFLYLLPVMSLLIALGSVGKWQKYLVAGGMLIFSLLYLLFPPFHREDWKSLAAILERKQQPVYMVESAADPLGYYSSYLQINDLAQISLVKLSSSVIVIPYVADVHGINYQQSLTDYGFKLIKHEAVREIDWQEWQR